MNSKTDREDRGFDDIAFLSEMIDNFIFWQEIGHFVKTKFTVKIGKYPNFPLRLDATNHRPPEAIIIID